MGRVDWDPEQQQGECVLGLLQFRADSGNSGKRWNVDVDDTGDGRETEGKAWASREQWFGESAHTTQHRGLDNFTWAVGGSRKRGKSKS